MCGKFKIVPSHSNIFTKTSADAFWFEPLQFGQVHGVIIPFYLKPNVSNQIYD